MPTYNNALTDQPANRLAFPSSIGPVPRNEYLGALADFLAKSYSPERTQQMQGISQLLGMPAVSRTLDMMSYGDPLTTGAGGLGGTTRVKPDVLEAAMTVAPLGKPATMATLQAARLARQAAMVGGKVAENYAERVVPQIMERGGLGAEMLQGMSNRTISPLDVYHGSPHGPFERFDPTKIGTGEGAQAYSFGHYLGEARGTGEGYRDILAYKAFDVAPEAEKLGLKLSAGTRGEFIRQTKDNKPPEVLAKQLQNANIAARDLPQDKLAELFKGYQERGGGYLYKVDLPDEAIAKMLDWDKPLTKQPNVMGALRSEAEQRVRDRTLGNIENDIRKSLPTQDVGDDFMSMFSSANVSLNKDIQAQALSKLNKMDLKSLIDKELNLMKPADMNWNMTGKEFYELLAKREGSPANASAMLQRQGVPGTRYLDQGSRTPSGSNTSNFVVYPGNENLLTIKEINDKPVNKLLKRKANK